MNFFLYFLYFVAGPILLYFFAIECMIACPFVCFFDSVKISRILFCVFFLKFTDLEHISL